MKLEVKPVAIYLLIGNFFIGCCCTRMARTNRRAILWDVDGTLCDSFKLGFESTKTVLEKNGYRHITADEYHAGTRLTTPRRLAWHATGDPDNALGIDLGKQFDDLYVTLVGLDTAPCYAGINSLVEDISKTYEHSAQGALSNACGAYVRAVLSANRINSIFSIQYGADDVPAAKPCPDGLLKCCNELEITPSMAVYIGDSPSDGEAAKAAGMYGVGVSWGSHPITSLNGKFDLIVHSVDELGTVIKEWFHKNS